MQIRSTKKIKILRIIDRLNIGGPAIHTILLTAGMNKDRFNSLLITGTVEKDEGEMVFLAEEKKVQPVIIPEMSRSLIFRNDLIAFWKLLQLIRKEKPDIIHTHKSKAGTLGRIAGFLFKWSFKPKLIHTFHGHVLRSYFSKFKSAVFTLIEKSLALITDKIIAVSDSVQKELIDLKIAPPTKIITIPLGLELNKFLEIKEEETKKNDLKTIGIIGRLVPVKNHKMFLDVASRIRHHSDLKKRVKFLIIGDGPLRQELEAYAEKVGLTVNVTFTGWIKDLKNIYSELDIIALTSLNEGSPVALIEAMAAGKPVVSTDVGGVRDLFTNKMSDSKYESACSMKYYDQGILVNPKDSEAMARAIGELLRSPDQRMLMGAAARKTVYPRYDIRRLINDMDHLYTKMIGDKA